MLRDSDTQPPLLPCPRVGRNPGLEYRLYIPCSLVDQRPREAAVRNPSELEELHLKRSRQQPEQKHPTSRPHQRRKVDLAACNSERTEEVCLNPAKLYP